MNAGTADPDDLPGATMQVETPICVYCRQTGWVNVPIAGYRAWQDGALIQKALPYLTTGQREQLVNGTHDDCFDRHVPRD